MGMVRTQIQLDQQDYQRVKEFAAERGLSLSGAIRMLIRERFSVDPEYQEKVQVFLAAAGAWEDPEGKSDVARNHDRYLYGKP